MIILCLWPVTGLTSYFSVILAFNVNIVKVNECNKLEERGSEEHTFNNFFEDRGLWVLSFLFWQAFFKFLEVVDCIIIV